MSSLLANYSTPSKFSRAAQRLGISEPPKRPANGFVRFQQENQAELKQSAQSQKDLFVLIGTKWRNLSAEQKEKYNKPFNTEIVSGQFVVVVVVLFFEHFYLALRWNIRRNMPII